MSSSVSASNSLQSTAVGFESARERLMIRSLLTFVRLSGGDDPPPAIAPRVGDKNSATINLSDCAYPVFSVFQTEIRPLVHKTVPNQDRYFKAKFMLFLIC